MKTQKKRYFSPKKSNFNFHDCLAIFLITTVSLFVRLWKIGFPDQIVFDEVYFGNFSTAYLNESFYSDIHPPFGKMIMAAIAWLTQYKGTIEFGSKLGGHYLTDEINYVSLRLTPSIFSSFCPTLLYCSMRNLGFSLISSLSSASLILFDFTSIIEAKFILSDSMLHFFTCLHVFTLTLFLRDQRLVFGILTGITLGIATSCKLTAMGLVLLDGITQIIWIFTERPNILNIILRAIMLLLPFSIIVVFSWVVHYDILKYHDHIGCYTESIFSPYLLYRDKMNYTYPGMRTIKRNIFKQIYQDIIRTHKANMRITIPHPWSSMPKNWPLLLDKYVLFYSGENRSIRCLGSPVSYWFSSFGIYLTVVLFVFRRLDRRIVVPFFGWFFSYLPFIWIPRAMFLYHYILPLFFATMNLSAVIECSIKKYKIILPISIIIITCAFACWIYFSPWIYGTYCENCNKKLLWLERWNSGPPEPLHFYGEAALKTKLIKGSISSHVSKSHSIGDIPLLKPENHTFLKASREL